MCDVCVNIGRRSLLKGALALGGVSLASGVLFGSGAQAQPVRAADTPDAALKLLVDGNARYAAN